MLTGIFVSLRSISCFSHLPPLFPLEFSLPQDVKRPASDDLRIQSAKRASLLDDSARVRRVTSHDVVFSFLQTGRRR